MEAGQRLLESMRRSDTNMDAKLTHAEFKRAIHKVRFSVIQMVCVCHVMLLGFKQTYLLN